MKNSTDHWSVLLCFNNVQDIFDTKVIALINLFTPVLNKSAKPSKNLIRRVLMLKPDIKGAFIVKSGNLEFLKMKVTQLNEIR